MANSTKEKRNFLKGSARAVHFNNGGHIIHIDLLKEDLDKLPVNKSGYVKISVSSLPKPDKFGNTHSVFENEFVPDPKFANKEAKAPGKTQTAGYGKRSSDDILPF